jgi:hypothetical protein
MARRNRKHGHDGNRMVFWGVPMITLMAALGLVYLHLHSTCEGLGRNIKRLENERAELNKRVVNEERNWVAARSIRNMETLMARHGIVMSWPAEQNIIRLRAAEPGEPAQYAFQGGAMRRD